MPKGCFGSKADWMLKDQLLERGIRDERVLKALHQTPRHWFVPELWKEEAYEDRPLPIGGDQTISQPYIVARMTELLELKGSEKVLEIGTGSGYQAAILAQLAEEVFSMELDPGLARTADKRLAEHGFRVKVRTGDGYQGWSEEAPFDRMLVTAAPERIPHRLVAQLAKGGKMVLPVGKDRQELIVLDKDEGGELRSRSVTQVRFVPMVHPEDEGEG